MKKSLLPFAATGFFSLAAITLFSSDSIFAQGNGQGNGNGPGSLPTKGIANLPFWGLHGSTGDSTTFAGTTNNNPFLIKVNNLSRASFTNSGMELLGNFHSTFANIDSIINSWKVVVDALETNTINAEQYYQNDTLVDLINLQTTITNIKSSQWQNDTINPSNIFYSAGNVGIGTSEPSVPLEVSGSIKITGADTTGSGGGGGTPPTPAPSKSIIIDGGLDRITATSGTIDFVNTNLNTTGTIQSASITTANLTIIDKIESDTMHARKSLEVNNSIRLMRDTAMMYAEVSTTDTAVALMLQKESAAGVVIGDATAPAPGESRAKLTVVGNTKLDGNVKINGDILTEGKITANTFNAEKFSSDTLSVYRITSPDSVIAFGDSTVLLNTVFHRLYVNDAATAGITIGNARINTTGFGALFQFLAQSALGKYSTAIGYNLRVNPSANYAMVIGSGLQSGTFTGTASGYLENNIQNSLMVGFNTSGSNPTLFVGPASGTLNSTGNVGIGTSTPATKLTVTGDGAGVANIGGGFCGGDYTGISLNGQTGNCGAYNILSSPTDKTLFINRPSGNSIRFRENNVDQMSILTGGNVGIRTSVPETPLDIEGNTTIFSGNLYFGGNGEGGGGRKGDTYIGHPGDGILTFFTDAGERMRIKNDGSVGIGTNSPDYKLDVCGTIRAKEIIVDPTSWCDFKLKPNYIRMTWQEKLAFIQAKGHLPEFDSGSEIETNGLKVNKTLYGMIWNMEDNTMDIIEIYKRLEKLEKENLEKDKKIARLETIIIELGK